MSGFRTHASDGENKPETLRGLGFRLEIQCGGHFTTEAAV